MNTLTVGSIISKGFEIGIKNIGTVAGAGILWILTFWIPYLNVGTTIGLMGIVVALSKGTSVSATEIFDPKYRKQMGEFFLLMAFVVFGTFAGIAFLVIPGLVLSIAWGQSIYIFLDRGMDPLEAIRASNKITYGKKWTIFWGSFLLGITMDVIGLVLFVVIGKTMPALALLMGFALYVAFMSVSLGAAAHIYGTLSKELDPA